MAYPANLTTLTATHKVVSASGRALKGNVYAVPAERVWATDGSIVEYEAKAVIAADGSYELVLPHIDQAGIRNKGVPWKITEDVPGQPRSFWVAPMVAMGTGSVDVATMLTTAPTSRDTVIHAGPVTDESMAAFALNPTSQFRGAVSDIIANDPNVTDAAATRAVTIAADPAIAGAVGTPGSATRQALTRSGQLPVGRNELVLDIRNFGADPTGTTTADAAFTAAFAELQARATAAGSQGGVILLGQAQYRLASTLTVPDWCALEGESYRGTRIYSTAAVAVALGSRSGLRKLHVLGNGTTATNGTNTGIKPAPDYGRATIDQVMVSGCAIGIDIESHWSFKATQSQIQTCGVGVQLRERDVNEFAWHGGHIGTCTTGIIIKATAVGVKWTLTQASIERNTSRGLVVENGHDVRSITVRDTYFEGNPDGHILADGNHRNLAIDGVAFTGSGAYCVSIAGGWAATIRACQFRSTTTGAKAIVTPGTTIAGLLIEQPWYQPGIEPDYAALAVTGLVVIDARYGSIFGRGEASGPNIQLTPTPGVPAAPRNGDIWATPTTVYVRLGSETLSFITSKDRRLFPRTTAGPANLNLQPAGGHPTAPENGDVWMTNTNMFVRIGGVTHQVNLTVVP